VQLPQQLTTVSTVASRDELLRRSSADSRKSMRAGVELRYSNVARRFFKDMFPGLRDWEQWSCTSENIPTKVANQCDTFAGNFTFQRERIRRKANLKASELGNRGEQHFRCDQRRSKEVIHRIFDSDCAASGKASKWCARDMSNERHLFGVHAVAECRRNNEGNLGWLCRR
jgi:hypothetical protein